MKREEKDGKNTESMATEAVEEKGLINVTPLLILMANAKDVELAGG